jgi:hypothetical protein
VQSAFLRFVRVEAKASPTPPEEETDEDDDVGDEASVVDIPFKPVTLTFTDICYDVKASKGNDTLRLLNNANGIFTSGRMLALMGSSGVSAAVLLLDLVAYMTWLTCACVIFFHSLQAGKTTLMVRRGTLYSSEPTTLFNSLLSSCSSFRMLLRYAKLRAPLLVTFV